MEPYSDRGALDLPAAWLRRWDEWRLFTWALAAFLIGYLAIPLAFRLAGADATGGGLAVAAVLGPLAGAALLLFGARRIGGSVAAVPVVLGLRDWRWSWLWKGALGAVGIMMAAGAVTVLWQRLAVGLGWRFGVPPTLEILTGGSPWQIGALTFTAVLTAPFFEELLFRKALFDFLNRDGRHRHLATAGTALAFAAVHLSWLQLPGFLVIGGCWQYANGRTGTVWSSIILHFFNNLFAMAALLTARYCGWLV